MRTKCQDDVSSKARARELAVTLVNRARAQLGAGDALQAEKALEGPTFHALLY